MALWSRDTVQMWVIYFWSGSVVHLMNNLCPLVGEHLTCLRFAHETIDSGPLSSLQWQVRTLFSQGVKFAVNQPKFMATDSPTLFEATLDQTHCCFKQLWKASQLVYSVNLEFDKWLVDCWRGYFQRSNCRVVCCGVEANFVGEKREILLVCMCMCVERASLKILVFPPLLVFTLQETSGGNWNVII